MKTKCLRLYASSIMSEALLYEKLDKASVRCFLCAHHCRIAEGNYGICGVRQNRGGTLHALVWGKPIAMHVDPIEKKPLYHFLPGSTSFSVATIGCNFRCAFCQNWQISQARFRDGGSIEEGKVVAPEEIVQAALKQKCKSISYTYTEPTVFFEYALDIATLAKAKGLANVFVTNGYMTKECLDMIRPFLDAANVDLKFFKDASYKKICGGSLEPVLDSIRLMKKMGIWVEVTTLVVPGENDSEEELTGIAEFIAGVDKDMPWHVSRFHPDYEFGDHGVTPEATLRLAQSIGDTVGLTYIYVGNIQGWGNDTCCPRCKKLLIKREVFDVLEYNIRDGKCVFCKTSLFGVF